MICKRKPEKQHVHACAKTLPRRWLITLEVIKLKKEPRKSFYAVRNMHSQVCAELSPSLGSCQRADVLCRILCLVFVLFFFFKLHSSMEPILRMPDILWQVPGLASQPKPGWVQRWMICHLGAGPCFSLNGVRKCRPTTNEVPSQGYETNENASEFPPQEAVKSLEEGDRVSRDVGGCERDKLQPSRVVSQAFRGTWNESTQRL